MMYKILNTIKHDFKLLAVDICEDYILIGGTSKELIMYNLPSYEFTTLAVHEKSIRAVKISKNYYGCASYDGTCTIYKDHKIIDVIEGPETEIKDLAFDQHNEHIAIATRGKTVWVLNMNEDCLEIDAVLDYHTQDVKGCLFYNENLYTYGYDNTIKVFEKTEYGKQDWELIQNIEEHSNTVWDLVFCDDKMVSCDANGYIYIYRFEGEWKLDIKYKASLFEIYSICVIDNKYLAYIMNLKNVMIVDFELKQKMIINDIHSGEINQIAYCNKTKRIVTVGDDGILNVVKINIE